MPTDAVPETEPGPESTSGDEYDREVGDHLRAIRQQQRLSLKQAADASRGAITASLLGAYERGERRVTVRRLRQLADLYRMAMDDLLPPRPDSPGELGESARGRPTGLPVRLNLDALRASDDERARALLRLSVRILRERGDFNGRVITLRHSDLEVVAAALDESVENLVSYLEHASLYWRPGKSRE